MLNFFLSSSSGDSRSQNAEQAHLLKNTVSARACKKKVMCSEKIFQFANRTEVLVKPVIAAVTFRFADFTLALVKKVRRRKLVGAFACSGQTRADTDSLLQTPLGIRFHGRFRNAIYYSPSPALSS